MIVINLIMSVTMIRPQQVLDWLVTVSMISFGMHTQAAGLGNMTNLCSDGREEQGRAEQDAQSHPLSNAKRSQQLDHILFIQTPNFRPLAQIEISGKLLA